ncbi:glycosyltransferase family 2 protein [Cognatishimia maritima]|uniref:Glycosyltransferase involved in cell wall bisynthesis n=1 Tax=Cognatishimia maritima TaxID=870908 RepID=A0A1M5WEL0_9RHOB|nr:glycosyltransferase family 2 protein [Cognatishimia maritima]SHH85663.1 Glycosyltransferase involved in cell wall bisynthesis [Cognatishimia maritima]
MQDIDPIEQAEAAPFVVSLIVPVFNEAEAVRRFVDTVTQVLAGVATFEVVFVNDGSRDATERKIEALMAEGKPLRLINLSRNFGKEAALAAGLAHARGDVIIPMDVDLQDPPELIPEMLERWRAGAKIVNARRIDRSQDTWAKRLSAAAYYRIFNWLAENPIPSNVGDFRLLDREVVQAVLQIGDRSRFNKGIFSWVGFETVEVTYERPARADGASSWSWWRLWTLALDGIFASSTAPLRIWSYVGGTMAVFAFAYSAYVFLSVLITGRDVPGYASTLIVILIFGGLNMVALGIIGEYIGRIYYEVRKRPLYIVRSVKESED